MTKTQILDCTLRDGGYVNDFQFGKRGIAKIIEQLTLAGVDIIETGFLEDGEYDEEASIYNTVDFFCTSGRPQTFYVCGYGLLW